MPRWKINGWTTGLCVLLLTTTALAWTVHQSALTTPPPRDIAPHPAAPAMAGPPLAHVVTAPFASSAPNQAAAIINDTAAPVQVEVVRRADQQRPAVARTPVPPNAAVVPGPIPRKAASRSTREVVATGHVSGLHNAKMNTVASAAPATDTDVTLLAALVAHASQPAAVITHPNRDVVERGDNDDTAELLRRCKQLGLIEGMLCRSRICSGRWENEAVCRTPSR